MFISPHCSQCCWYNLYIIYLLQVLPVQVGISCMHQVSAKLKWSGNHTYHTETSTSSPILEYTHTFLKRKDKGVCVCVNILYEGTSRYTAVTLLPPMKEKKVCNSCLLIISPITLHFFAATVIHELFHFKMLNIFSLTFLDTCGKSHKTCTGQDNKWRNVWMERWSNPVSQLITMDTRSGDAAC